MELFIPSIFNVVAGMSILASALHRLVKMYFSKPGDEQGGTSNYNAPKEEFHYPSDYIVRSPNTNNEHFHYRLRLSSDAGGPSSVVGLRMARHFH